MTMTLDLPPVVVEPPAKDYWFIQDAAEVPAALASLRGLGSDLLCLDTETTGLDAHQDQLLLLQLHVPGSPLLVFDCRTIPLDYLTEQVRPFLCSPHWLKVGHNLGFDYGMIFAKLGLCMTRLYDTMIVERLLTAGTFADCGLGMTAERYLGVHLDKSVRKQFIGMAPDHEFTHEQLHYSAQDVQVLPPIVRAQQRRLVQQHMVEVARLEFEVLPALAEAHVWGVQIDVDKWRAYIQQCEAEVAIKGTELSALLQPYVEQWRAQKEADAGPAYAAAVAEREAFKGIRDLLGRLAYDATLATGGTAGEARRAYNEAKKSQPLPELPKKPDAGTGPINLGSSEQVGYALLAMGVPIPVNENGRPVTKKEVLEELSDEHDAVAQLVAIRKLSKTVESFGESILRQVDEAGKLHPHFNQLVSTGRMSCSEPNVQQMSPAVRACFIAPPGKALLSVDFHMIEMVILAEVTGEPMMQWAINAGLDLHSLTALKMFPEVQAACKLSGAIEEMVAEAQADPAALAQLKALLDFVKREFDPPRKVAKMINFGVAYGISAMGLSSKLHITLDNAKSYIQSYFASNPNVDAWLKRTGLAGQRALRSTTILGRHRYFRPVRKEDYTEPWMVGAAERRMARQVCNHVIQGTSADITKTAVVLVRQALQAGGWDAQMLAFVHDELLLVVAEDQLAAVQTLVESKMVEAGRRLVKKVDVTVSAASGTQWMH